MRSFEQVFGGEPTVRAAAPGRVNLIGEHTDYNGGFVLPTPIPQTCRGEMRTRPDDLVRVWSNNAADEVVEYRLGKEARRGDWLDYVQGCTRMVGAGSKQGFELRLESDVPLGSGLSSSAALGVCVLRLLRDIWGSSISDLELAQLVQKVENEFVGARVGIMDPLVASVGKPGFALFIDARDLVCRELPLPPEVELLVINSGVKHRHSAGDYNTRRAECEAACRLLGVNQLRDLSSKDLGRIALLPEPLNRRARHVVTENERVLEAVVALGANDLETLGRLFDASHESQRTDYEVSIPEIDLLVQLAHEEEGVYGARLTGGGFGGSVLALARAGSAGAVGRRVAADYRARTGHQAWVLSLARSP